MLTNLRLYPDLRLISGFAVDVDSDKAVRIYELLLMGSVRHMKFIHTPHSQAKNINVSKQDYQHLFAFMIKLLAGTGFKQIKTDTLQKILALLPANDSDKYGKVSFVKLIEAVVDEFNTTIRKLSYNGGESITFETAVETDPFSMESA